MEIHSVPSCVSTIATALLACPNTARQMFDQAVAADPTAETPRAWRAKFLLSVGDFDEAGRDFRTISQDAPTSGSAVGSFGEWLVLGRDYVRASAVLAQAVDLGNHPGFTRYWLARSYYLRELDAQALRLSNVLIGMYPNEASALVLRLRVEAKDGDIRDALADFHRIERIPDVGQTDPVALVSAEVAIGKRAEALRVVQRYVSSGVLDLDEMARLRTDPDLDSLRTNPGPTAGIVL